MNDDLAYVALGEEDVYQTVMRSPSTPRATDEEDPDATSDDEDLGDEDFDDDDDDEPAPSRLDPIAASLQPRPVRRQKPVKKKGDKVKKALAEYGTFHVLKKAGNKRSWGWIETFEDTTPPSRHVLRDRFGPGDYRVEDAEGGVEEFKISLAAAPAPHVAGAADRRGQGAPDDRHRLVMTTLLSLGDRIDDLSAQVSAIDVGPFAKEVARRLPQTLATMAKPLLAAFEKERAELGAALARIEGDVAALKAERERQGDDQLTTLSKAIDELRTRVSNPPPAAVTAPADPYDRILDDLTRATAFVQRIMSVNGARGLSASDPPSPAAGEPEQPAWVPIVVNALQAFSGMLRASTPPFQGAVVGQAPPPPGAPLAPMGLFAPAAPLGLFAPAAPVAGQVVGQAAPVRPMSGHAAPLPPNGHAAAASPAGPPAAPPVAELTPEIGAETQQLGEALGLAWPELVSIAQRNGWDAETLLHATRLWTQNAATLKGMTPEIEAELRRVAERMGIPYEYGIGLAREHGLDAPALLELARRQLEGAAGASGGTSGDEGAGGAGDAG